MRRALLAAAVALVAVLGSAVALADPDPVGRWRTDEGRRAHAASYAAALATLPRPDRAADVATDFGTVRAYGFGTGLPGLPAVLLPGRSAGAPMWTANLPGLAAARPVWVLDTLGDAGMSVQTRPIRDAADQAAWLDQALGGLGLGRVHLVGHSFGGWAAANLALRAPGRVASLALLDPVLVLTGLRWQVYVRSIPATVPFLPRGWREGALAGLGGEERFDADDPVARMIADGAEHYAAALPLPERPTTGQLGTLAPPVLALMAADSAMHDPAAAVATARAAVPDVDARSVPGATHSLPLQFPDEVDGALVAFWTGHDG